MVQAIEKIKLEFVNAETARFLGTLPKLTRLTLTAFVGTGTIVAKRFLDTQTRPVGQNIVNDYLEDSVPTLSWLDATYQFYLQHLDFIGLTGEIVSKSKRFRLPRNIVHVFFRNVDPLNVEQNYDLIIDGLQDFLGVGSRVSVSSNVPNFDLSMFEGLQPLQNLAASQVRKRKYDSQKLESYTLPSHLHQFLKRPRNFFDDD